MAFLEFASVMVASIWVYLFADIAEKPKSRGFTKKAFAVYALVEIGATGTVAGVLGGLV